MSREEHWKGSSAAARAKEALENVCSGAHLSAASEHYSRTFVDHVNDVQFRGLAGVERSVRFYRSLFSEMAITVMEQLVDGDRVVSRFVVTGTRTASKPRMRQGQIQPGAVPGTSRTFEEYPSTSPNGVVTNDPISGNRSILELVS